MNFESLLMILFLEMNFWPKLPFQIVSYTLVDPWFRSGSPGGWPFIPTRFMLLLRAIQTAWTHPIV